MSRSAKTTGAGAPPVRRNFHGRRHGKTLKANQQQWLAEDLPRLSPGPVDPAENPGRRPLDLRARFGDRPIWLEVGFGGGEHLVRQAAANPDVALIGCEPFVNGVAMLLGKLRRTPLDNIAVHAGDVRDLFDVLPDASIARAFVLYPDPWPKKRHHKRRFVTPGYLAPLARVMAPGAELRMATDIADYARQAREEVPGQGFEAIADGPEPWDDWRPTRYEAKALREGRAPVYLTWRRRPVGPAGAAAGTANSAVDGRDRLG